MKYYRRLLRKKHPTGEEVGLVMLDESCRAEFGEDGRFTGEEIAELVSRIPPDSYEKTMLNFYLGAASVAGKIELYCSKQLEEIRVLSMHLALRCVFHKTALIAEGKRLHSPEFKKEITERIRKGRFGYDRAWGLWGTSTVFDVLSDIASMRFRMQSILASNKFLKTLSDSLGGENDLYIAFETDAQGLTRAMFNACDSVFCEADFSLFKDVRDALAPILRRDVIFNGFNFYEDDDSINLMSQLKEFRERILSRDIVKDSQFSDQLWNKYAEYLECPPIHDDLMEALGLAEKETD